MFRLLAALFVPFLHVVAKFDLRGTENVPASGAFVLAPNHFSEIDPLVMGYSMWHLGRMPRYLAKASLFRIPFFGAVLRATGQVPVMRSTGADRANDPITAARKIAKDGSAVVIYPEGTLTRDPDLWPMRGKSGAVRTALLADIPIIPAAHWGTQKLLPRYSKRIKLFPRTKITILFGPQVDLSAFRGRPLDASDYTAATAVVMEDITKLVETLRGETAPAQRWDPSTHNQAETGRFEQQ